MLVIVLKLKTDWPCLSNSGCIATGTLQESDKNSHYAELVPSIITQTPIYCRINAIDVVQCTIIISFVTVLCFTFLYVLIKIPLVNS